MQKLLTALLLTAVSQGAIAQQLELFSTGTPTGNGPVTSSGAATFQLSTGATTTAFTPATTVSFAFQSAAAYTGSGQPGLIMGGTTVNASTTSPASASIFIGVDDIGSPASTQYTSDPFGTAGTGFDVATNYGARMFTDVSYLDGQNKSGRYEYGTLTLTFSRPVLNPVIHIAGIGGFSNTLLVNGNQVDFLGYYTEFELSAANVSAGYTLTERSGSTYFHVPTTGAKANIAILNNSTTPTSLQTPAYYTAQSGSNSGSGGSVRVNTNGTPITTITFRVFLRGDGGYGQNTGWVSSSSDRPGDAYIMSVSLPTYSLAGNVFNDVNGLTDNFVNGVSTPLPTLYANLIASNGSLYRSTQVTNGTYSFPNVVADDYNVVLTTTATSTSAALPAGWQNTGENWAAPTVAGSDGSVNGVLAVTVGASATQTAVTNANFAIQQPPTAGGGVVNGILNPGGTQQYSVTQANWTNTTATTDPTPGAVTAIRITGFPTGATSLIVDGTSYTASSTVWTTGGITLSVNSSGQPTASISVDPAASGVTQVSIPFVARDAAGAESANIGAAVINFIDLTLSGTAYNDTTGGIINGRPIGNAASIGSSTLQQLYVNLVSAGGQVRATRALPTSGATGTYTFGTADGIEANTTYTVVLSTTQGVVGTTTGATSTLPGGWVRTAEGVGGTTGDGNPNGIQSVSVATTSVVNRDFAIERQPESDNKSYTLSPSPTQGQIYVLNGSANNGTGANPPVFTGSDPEDQPTSGSLSGKTVRIVTLPNNGQLWYVLNGTPTQITTTNYTINNFNPSNMQWRATGSNYTSTTFQYMYVDVAGVPDGTGPANYTLTWSTPLAVELVRFDATAAGCDAKIVWEVEPSAKAVSYDVEFSHTGDARDFATVVSTEAGKLVYEATYAQPQAQGFYRLRISEASGAVSFSSVRNVRTSCGKAAASISLSPNPTQGVVKVDGLQAGSVIRLFDMNGKMVMTATASGTTSNLDLGTLATGTYHLVVAAAEGSTEPQSFKVVKQ